VRRHGFRGGRGGKQSAKRIEHVRTVGALKPNPSGISTAVRGHRRGKIRRLSRSFRQMKTNLLTRRQARMRLLQMTSHRRMTRWKIRRWTNCPMTNYRLSWKNCSTMRVTNS
jgi:hypothetical protein